MKRILAAGAAAAVVLVGVLAMAASLGGVSSTTLGADSTVVASCDTDGVTSSYNVSYDPTDSRDEVVSTVVGGVAVGCAGKSLTVTLTNGAGAVLDTATVVAVSGSNTVATTTPPDAELVANIHIVING